MTQKQVEDLQATLGRAERPEVAPADASDEEDEALKRRKGIAPKPGPGDRTALRMLASWRFANPGALAAIAWPQRSTAGQEWRMRRFVDCEWFGRRRLRFASTRHAVWVKPPGIREFSLNFPPPPPRSAGVMATLERWQYLRGDPKTKTSIEDATKAFRGKPGHASPVEVSQALETAASWIDDAIAKGDKSLERAMRIRLLALEDLALEFPAPVPPLVTPRWSEHAARQGWMRSVVAAAYVKAGWQYSPAGIDGPALRAFKNRAEREAFVLPSFQDRVFQADGPPYPYDLALGRRADGKPLLHILVVDDAQAALDRQLYPLPLVGPPERSSRIAVRFFPIDDGTIWSETDQRYDYESARMTAMRTNLQAAGLWEIKAAHEGPPVPPWVTHAGSWDFT